MVLLCPFTWLCPFSPFSVSLGTKVGNFRAISSKKVMRRPPANFSLVTLLLVRPKEPKLVCSVLLALFNETSQWIRHDEKKGQGGIKK